VRCFPLGLPEDQVGVHIHDHGRVSAVSGQRHAQPAEVSCKGWCFTVSDQRLDYPSRFALKSWAWFAVPMKTSARSTSRAAMALACSIWG
jgi:hypothetical protein